MSSQEITQYHQPQPAAMISYADMEKMAACIAGSGLFGVKNPVQALALMLIAQADGLHPATAARDYHVIQGRPSLKADTILARFQAVGGTVKWREYTETVCAATFTHPSGGSVEIEWTLELAKKANLTGREMWKQYPRAMLRARVISEGIRTVFPGVLSGMYTPEEVRDMVEVTGDAETTGPDRTTSPSQPTPAPSVTPAPDVTVRDFDEEIAAITDKADLREWLKDTAKSYGWNKGDPVFAAVKAACAERAAEIDAAVAKAATEARELAEFEEGLGPVEEI